MPEQGTSHVLLAALHPASTRLLGERLATTPKDDISVRATLLFSSQRAAERLLALTNPCWSLPIGCSWFTEVESKALLPYTPLKVRLWR